MEQNPSSYSPKWSNAPPSMGSGALLPCSQEATTGSHSKTDTRNLVVFNPSSRGIQSVFSWYSIRLSWYSIRLLVVFNPSRGIEISFVVFKSVSWYLNPSRGIPIRNVVFKSGSWYSNSSRGIQIRLLAFKFVSWWANSS